MRLKEMHIIQKITLVCLLVQVVLCIVIAIFCALLIPDQYPHDENGAYSYEAARSVYDEIMAYGLAASLIGICAYILAAGGLVQVSRLLFLVALVGCLLTTVLMFVGSIIPLNDSVVIYNGCNNALHFCYGCAPPDTDPKDCALNAIIAGKLCYYYQDDYDNMCGELYPTFKTLTELMLATGSLSAVSLVIGISGANRFPYNS